MTKKKKIEEQYKKLTQREHVLQRSDTYIGSINSERRLVFTVDDINNFENIKIVKKEINYNAGLIKIFDEIITNASDHSVKTGRVKSIKVEIENNRISVWNDGDGIPVVIHKDEKVYVPELIFGHLLTGENYDDSEQRIGGGRNGIGSKACNIFSKEFIVETADGKNYYKQVFTDNLSTDKKGKLPKPHIRATSKKFTKISFLPDYERFGFTDLTDDIKSVMIKRIIDIAAYNPNVKVYFNNNLISVKSFKDYMKFFMLDENEIIYEKINDFWEVGIMKTFSDSFEQISLVNGLATLQGGTHVNYIVNQITNKLKTSLSRGNKFEINPNDIKSKIFLFLNSKLYNPEFDSQVKEILTTKISNFKDIDISDNFIKKILKSDITQEIIDYIELKEQLALQKAVKNKNNTNIRIPKLVDAIKAGTKESLKCHLFITEGDSASSFAISGFKYTGREYYGSFPIRGKILNVRDLSLSKIKDNAEITNIAKILGLEFNSKVDESKLRYGKIVLMTDADTDGYHIKGLIINFLEYFFPELLVNNVYEFITPIIKVSKNNNNKYFYKIKDFEKWCKTINIENYKIKYFKGLGGLTKDEIELVFKDIDNHLIKFNYNKSEETKNLIDLAFNKKRSNDRKNWLSNFVVNKNFDKLSQETTYESFFNNEFIEFSFSDNIRSIPHIMDGLKPVQRKILYSFFKLNTNDEVNVGELFGQVKSTAKYHHSPAALEMSIINMAQNFIGTNNYSLLKPNGNFGTRLQGGFDAAAPRYIHTEINDLTNKIFNKNDVNLIKYTEMDGIKVEPEFYLPIIPIALLNGCNGIGTGWSTYIPNYNINDIIQYIENKLLNKRKNIKLNPFYDKFKGEIINIEGDESFITKGIIKKISDYKLNITELPIGVWNDKYYDFLDTLVDDKKIKSYIKLCNDEDVNIIINLYPDSLINNVDLINFFNLSSKFYLTNMHLFDINNNIKKYNNVYEIINEFYDNRLPYYQKRKDFILSELVNKKEKLDNLYKFLALVISKKIKLNNVKIIDINKSLENYGFSKIDDSYNYLLNIPLIRLTADEMIKIENKLNEINNEIIYITNISVEKMWLNDLKNVNKQLS
jgi:DNA topoisomerase-2